MSLPGTDSPWQGRSYVINEWGSANVITFDSGAIKLQKYDADNENQRWDCESKNGWLAFGHSSTNQNPFIGYNDDKILKCEATAIGPWEYFAPRLNPKGGFALLMLDKDGNGMRPVGKENGRLAEVEQTSIKFGFTRVD